jgi:ribosome-binding factor A
MNIKDEKMTELIKNLAANFLQQEAGKDSMITVTNATYSERAKTATVFFTVFPEDKEENALSFAKRKRAEFREYFKDNSRTRVLPFFDFEIDKGEKNRQKIDRLLSDE